MLTISSRELDELLVKGVQNTPLIASKTPLKMENVLERPSCEVGFLRRQGMDIENKLIALYSLLIKEACEMFPNSIKDERILNNTSIMLLNEYPELKLSELIIILQNGIAGKYGRIYHAISGAAIMDWALNYFHDRTVYFENKSINKGKQFDFRETPSVILNSMKKVHESLTDPETKQEEKGNNTIEKEHNDVVQDWLREFMRLSKEQGYPHNGRFIKYNNKMLDQEEFLQAKLKELNQK